MPIGRPRSALRIAPRDAAAFSSSSRSSFRLPTPTTVVRLDTVDTFQHCTSTTLSTGLSWSCTWSLTTGIGIEFPSRVYSRFSSCSSAMCGPIYRSGWSTTSILTAMRTFPRTSRWTPIGSKSDGRGDSSSLTTAASTIAKTLSTACRGALRWSATRFRFVRKARLGERCVPSMCSSTSRLQ